MDLHIGIAVCVGRVFSNGTVGRDLHLRMIFFEPDPVEGIGIWVVDLVEEVLEVELLEILGREKIVHLRSLEEGIGISL